MRCTERCPAAVHAVAGGTGHAHLGVFALFPVQILLVAVFGFSTGPEIFGIMFVSGIYFVEIQLQVGLALVGLIFDRIGVLAPILFTAAGMAGAAYLGR